MSGPSDTGSAVEEIVVLIVAVMVAAAGVWMLFANLNCETACGTPGERTGVYLLAGAATACGGGATVLAARGRLAASFGVSVVGMVALVIGVAIAFSNVS